MTNKVEYKVGDEGSLTLEQIKQLVPKNWTLSLRDNTFTVASNNPMQRKYLCNTEEELLKILECLTYLGNF